MIASLESLLYIVEIIIGITFIIMIHEFGHFIIAKWRGVRCETFSIGFGPKILKWLPKYPWKPKDKDFKYKNVITPDILEDEEKLRWALSTNRLRVRMYDIDKVSEGMVARKYIFENSEEKEYDGKDLNEKDDNPPKIAAELLTKQKIQELKDKGLEKLPILDASETEYAISLIWLGGYVKMAGETEADKKYVTDDQFMTKKPGSKAMILVAGVTMNAISAMLLFVLAFSIGVAFINPSIGSITPTVQTKDGEVPSPAWLSGLKEGDKILKINGKEIKDFTDVQVAVAYTDEDENIELTIEREGVKEPLTFNMLPVINSDAGFPTIGVEPSICTKVGEISEDRAKELEGKLLVGDVIRGVKDPAIPNDVGEGVRTIDKIDINQHEDLNKPYLYSYSHLRTLLSKIKGDKVTLKVIRDGKAIDIKDVPMNDKYLSVSFGLDMYENVPILSVKNDGPAANAINVETGELAPIKAGDVIYRVNGKVITSFDMLRREIHKLEPGVSTEIVVIRFTESNTDMPIFETLSIIPQADAYTGKSQFAFVPELPNADAPQTLAITGIEESCKSELIQIESTVDDAEIAKIAKTLQIDDVITSINGEKVTTWNNNDGNKGVNDYALESWENVANQYELPKCKPVAITVLRKIIGSDSMEKEVALKFNVTAYSYDDLIQHNVIGFAPMQSMVDVKHSFGKAITAGFEKTWVFAKMVVMTIKSIISSRISAKNIGGPILIAQASFKIAKLGIGKLIYFMALLSINLAIINILPIPVLDGGHLVFVLIERLRGKPVSEKVMGIANLVGFILLMGLIVLVLFNDIARIVS